MKLWPWYKFADRPENGIYELVMLAGLDRSLIDVPTRDRTLYICKSLEGYLTEAIPSSALMDGKIIMATRAEAVAAGAVILSEDDDDEEDGS